MVKASQFLYNLFSAKLKRPLNHYVDVLKDSISLILFSIAHLNPVCPSEERSGIAKAAFNMLDTTLWKWITDPAVIGGSLFGGRIVQYTRLDKAEEEFKVNTCNLTVASLMYIFQVMCYLTDMAMHAQSGMSTKSSSER